MIVGNKALKKLQFAIASNWKAIKEVQRKQHKVITGKELKEDAGFVQIIGIILMFVVIATLVGIMFYFYKNNIAPSNEAGTYASELNAIIQGLNSYYSGYQKYPAGSGWTWNTNNAYVPQRIIGEGWQYSCQDAKITITTPAISNPKTLEKTKAKFSSLCDQVLISSNKVQCILLDKPCWQ